MNTKIFEVKCITNLHIGTSGSAYGVIKNEVEKDVVLNTPLLPASGIKGALRDFWRQNNKKYQAILLNKMKVQRENVNF